MNMRARVKMHIVVLGLRGLIAAAMLAVLWAAAMLPAAAQTDGAPPARDYVSCGHFETQEDAQEVLDSGNLDENGVASLDGDGDGIACEVAFGLEEPAPATCETFLSQEDAQWYLDVSADADPALLDADGDGVACEDAFATGGADESADAAPASVVSLPNTGSGAIATGDSALGLLAGFATVSLVAALAVRQGSRR